MSGDRDMSIDLTRRIELVVVWEEPPPLSGYRSPSDLRHDVLTQFKTALVAEPGRWAVLPLDGLGPQNETRLRAHVATINKRRASWEGTHVWKAVYRNGKVYVQYIGEDESNETP